MTQTTVTEKLSRPHQADPIARKAHDIHVLKETKQLLSTLDIADAAAPLEIIADVGSRTIEVGMVLKTPENRVSTKARLNWVLRQIKSDDKNLYIRFYGQVRPNKIRNQCKSCGNTPI